MSNDLSLSRALGGLRIANPDDATPSPPQSHPTDTEAPTRAQPAISTFTPDVELQKTQSRPQISESPRTAMSAVEPEPSNLSSAYTQMVPCHTPTYPPAQHLLYITLPQRRP